MDISSLRTFINAVITTKNASVVANKMLITAIQQKQPDLTLILLDNKFVKITPQIRKMLNSDDNLCKKIAIHPKIIRVSNASSINLDDYPKKSECIIDEDYIKSCDFGEFKNPEKLRISNDETKILEMIENDELEKLQKYLNSEKNRLSVSSFDIILPDISNLDLSGRF